jgi:hypothetical protein
MTLISRRHFLAAAAASFAATRLQSQAKSEIAATLQVPAAAAGPQLPANFFGLSYEVEQLAVPGFFSAQNAGLIHAFKAVSPRGILRLGGNSSEFTWFKPTADTPEPSHAQVHEFGGQPKPNYYPLTADAIRSLAAFLEAAGWTCIYGINMGTNTPPRAADEAEFVAKTLGPHLEYFQIGNEVDLYKGYLRDANTWTPKAYLDEWLTFARAVLARAPGTRLAMPDSTDDISWLTQIAGLWSGIANPPRIAALTHHYYFNGPPQNPDVTIANLLTPATMARVQWMASTTAAAAAKIGTRYHLTEGNSVYSGGKAGLSDVFAAALWSADYSLLLASKGYTGINLHGGTGKWVANAAAGATPAQLAATPVPAYTPIAAFGSEFVLQPVAYGMMFARSLSGASFIDTDFTWSLQKAGINATAYAAKLPGGAISMIVLNKDTEKDLALQLNFGSGESAPVTTQAMQAPALDSREAHITSPASAGRLKDGKMSLRIPHASGLLLRVG